MPESMEALREVWNGATAQGGKRNPRWERDELILALDLYIRLDRALQVSRLVYSSGKYMSFGRARIACKSH